MKIYRPDVFISGGEVSQKSQLRNRSNMYVLIFPRSVTYHTCRPSLVPNKQWIKPRKHSWLLMWTNIRLRKTNCEALFFCFLYSPLYTYKSGSNVVLLSLYQWYIVQKISKVEKTSLRQYRFIWSYKNKQAKEYRILKVHPVSSFALAFPVYIRLVENNDHFASQPRTTECTARFSQD